MSVAVAAVAVVGNGRADPNLAVELAWNAPAGCPSAEVVNAEIARLLDGSSSPQRVVATATVIPTAHGFRLALTMHSPANEGTRTIESPRCASLADATALILALAVDPSAIDHAPPAAVVPIVAVPIVDERSASAPGEHSTPAAPPAAASTARDLDHPPHRPSLGHGGTDRSYALSISAAGSYGPLPRAAYGFEVSGALLTTDLRLEVGFEHTPANRGVLASRDVGGDFSLTLGRALGCYRMREWVGVCGGSEIGRLNGEGFGVRTRMHGAAVWAASTLGLHVTVGGRVLALRLAVDAVVPWFRPDFVIEGLDRVHTPSAIGVRALTGIEIRLL